MAREFFEIPLSPTQQRFSISLAGRVYNLRFLYRASPTGAWIMDIDDGQGNPLVYGIPLIPGVDLLGQYKYLNFGGSMVVIVDGDENVVPTYTDLGILAHLYFTPDV